MKKLISTLIICNILFQIGIGQSFRRQAHHWHFGDSISLDFNNPCNIQGDSSAIITSEGSATMSDGNGNLLFYTNGGGRDSLASNGQNTGMIWNSAHEVMYDMQGIEGGGFSAAQSSIILPKPGDSANYYLFTMDESEFDVGGNPLDQPNGRGLSYFEIDMELNNGLGEVVDYQEMLIVPAAEGLSATIKSNEEEFWLIAYDDNISSYKIFAVDTLGIFVHDSLDISPFDPQYFINPAPIKISPDGSKMHAEGVFFNFDITTGRLSVDKIIPETRSSAVSFSPNSEYFYAIENNEIIQYDLTIDSFETTRKFIDFISGTTHGQMQVAPDGLIYYLDWNIQNETMGLSGILCSNTDAPCLKSNIYTYDLDSNEVFLGLPNFMDIHFKDDSDTKDLNPCLTCSSYFICPGDTLPITSTHYLAETWEWSTGDTTQNIEVTSPGEYTLTITDGCCNSGVGSILLSGPPDEELILTTEADPPFACDGGPTTITALTNFASSFEWSNGGTGQSITVTEPGSYFVTGTDLCGNMLTASASIEFSISNELSIQAMGELGCNGNQMQLLGVFNGQHSNFLWSTGDTISSIVITEPGTYTFSAWNSCDSASTSITISKPSTNIQLPKAFTPDEDGTNDYFRPIWNCPDLDAYRMVIYSRWGQQVFKSENPDAGWGGMQDGRPAPSDVYVYLIDYVAEDGDPVQKKGTITLIR